MTPPEARFSWRQAAFCGLLAVAIDLALGSYQWNALLRGGLLNPDSYMRLVRLHDILAAHAPLDLIARDGSGDGTILYWSHLLDSLLLLLATPVTLVTGQQEALRWAGIALGPLTAGLLGIALAWATAPLSDPAWRWTASLIGMLSIPIVGYSQAGVVHHHALVALAAVMCAGWAGRVASQEPGAALRLGAWAAFGLWLSPEVMPIALMAFGAVGLGWLLHHKQSHWGAALATATTTFVVLVALILTADPPLADLLSVELDRLSLPWLVLAILGAQVAWLLILLDRRTKATCWRNVAGGALAIAAAGVWLALYPAALRGTTGVVSGAEASIFFANIAEMQPVRTFPDATVFLLLGTFATCVAGALAIGRRSPLLGYATACLCLLVLAAALHRRFSTYGACAGAAAVPVALTQISQRLRSYHPLWPAACRLSLLLFLLVAPFAVQLAHARKAGADRAGTCSLQQAADQLQPYAGEVILADVNATPELLYRTRLRTVGSLYHSNAAAYLRLRDAWRSRQLDSAPMAVKATRATLFLICPRSERSVMVADLPTDSLWDRLSRDEPPSWLREVPLSSASGFRLFRRVGISP